ncbi:MAG TPA: hypothetical protein VFY84_04765 [Jiangellales bacterium]|nr:hypothetical protein [Jiangellales bacterium]
MSTDVLLPALDGQQALGFLAALGVLRVLGEHAGADVRLRFDDESPAAVLTGPYPDLDVAEALTRIATSGDSLIPGLDPHFPLPRSGSGDPMRASRAEHRARWQEYGEARRRWTAAMVTDLAVDDKGRVALTPYAAPWGQQILRTFVDKPVTAVREQPETIREALAGWRRAEILPETRTERGKIDSSDLSRGVGR